MTSAVQFTMICLKIFGQINWEWIYISGPFILFILFSIFACIIKIVSLLMRKKEAKKLEKDVGKVQ